MKLISKKRNLLKWNKKQHASDSPPDPAEVSTKKSKKKRIIIIAISVAVVLLLILGLKSCGGAAGTVGTNATYTTATAEKKDITVTLSGSGTLKPADSYDVTSLVAGEILSGDFKEGDTVDKGTVLYQINTKDAETSIRSAELNLEKSQLSYNNMQKSLSNLNVSAPVYGTITELNVKVGDNVASGQKIGTIRNTSVMSLKVPFNSADVSSFYVGQSAEVTLDSTFETLTGTVSKISNSEQVLVGNMLVKYVTIEVSNPGGITDSTVGTAKVGEIACNSSASFTYKSAESITAKSSGEVSSISADEGDTVQKGAVIIRLSNSELEESAKNAKLSLEEAQNSLDNKKETLKDYTITSPISGTIISKKCKAGDKLDSTSGKTAMCTIYDLSYLTMELSVDELDISKVVVGQKVKITADAVEGKAFTGEVTKVNISGTTTNGVTAYPVTIKITDTDGLLPGMNVSAEIVVESVKSVLSVPVDAVSRGNKVLICKDTSKMKTAEDGTLVLGSSGLPEGFEYADVKLGVNNDEYIEVTEGLSEGDTVAVVHVVDNSMGMYQDMPAEGEQEPGSDGPPEGDGNSDGPSGG